MKYCDDSRENVVTNRQRLLKFVFVYSAGSFDAGMSIRRHTTYNLIGAVLPVALSLVTVPIYLRLLGEARYGVLAIAWLLLGYFSLFDLGLGRATAQHIAALRDSSAERRAQSFWTAFTVNVGLGIIGGLLIWPVAAYFFTNIFIIEDALRPEIQAAVPWLVLAVPMATLAGVLTGALQGRERFLELNLISVIGTLLFQVLPLAVAILWSPNLGVLLPAALLARLVTVFTLFARCKYHVFAGHPVMFLPALAVGLLRFGGWVTVSAIVGPMMVILDRFVIGALSGAKAVSYYTVPFQLAERSTIISSALTSSLFPRFAAATREEEYLLGCLGLRVLLVVMTPLVSVGILFMGPFLSWWITTDFAQRSALVGQILLLGFWVNSFARIPLSQLQARGRPDIVAKCHLVELLPYVGLLYVGLDTFGLTGAAAAFSVRVLADFGLLAGFAGTLQQSLRLLLTPIFLLAVALFFATLIKPGQPGWFMLVCLHLLITVLWAWRQAPIPLRTILLTSFSSSVGRLRKR